MKGFESGNYINQGTYKSFQPTFINREWALQDMYIIQLLSQAAYKLVANLEGLGIIKEITGGKRSKVYLFEEYIELFKL